MKHYTKLFARRPTLTISPTPRTISSTWTLATQTRVLAAQFLSCSRKPYLRPQRTFDCCVQAKRDDPKRQLPSYITRIQSYIELFKRVGFKEGVRDINFEIFNGGLKYLIFYFELKISLAEKEMETNLHMVVYLKVNSNLKSFFNNLYLLEFLLLIMQMNRSMSDTTSEVFQACPTMVETPTALSFILAYSPFHSWTRNMLPLVKLLREARPYRSWRLFTPRIRGPLRKSKLSTVDSTHSTFREILTFRLNIITEFFLYLY